MSWFRKKKKEPEDEDEQEVQKSEPIEKENLLEKEFSLEDAVELTKKLQEYLGETYGSKYLDFGYSGQADGVKYVSINKYSFVVYDPMIKSKYVNVEELIKNYYKGNFRKYLKDLQSLIEKEGLEIRKA